MPAALPKQGGPRGPRLLGGGRESPFSGRGRRSFCAPKSACPARGTLSCRLQPRGGASPRSPNCCSGNSLAGSSSSAPEPLKAPSGLRGPKRQVRGRQVPPVSCSPSGSSQGQQRWWREPRLSRWRTPGARFHFLTTVWKTSSPSNFGNVLQIYQDYSCQQQQKSLRPPRSPRKSLEQLEGFLFMCPVFLVQRSDVNILYTRKGGFLLPNWSRQ